jgi:hypothetical protein
VYRDLGLGVRSIPATAKALGFSQRSGQLEAWSSRNRRRERVNACDAEIERKKQAALTEEIQTMARRHATAVQDCLAALIGTCPGDGASLERRSVPGSRRPADGAPLNTRCAMLVGASELDEDRAPVSRGEPSACAQSPIYGTVDLFQRIESYAAAFERVLNHRAETEVEQ